MSVCNYVQSTFKVEVSYYEIYKERIHDLLASTKDKKRINVRNNFTCEIQYIDCCMYS